ncbi:MAG: shikimate kinase [Anaerolineae bacterium]|nr:shikimate kinase [Anaerolineae bacterium]
MCAGKSTIAQCLAGQLNMPRYELDEMRWNYYAEIGYDPATLAPIAQAEGMVGVARYWKPFEVYAVERVLADAPQAIVDFGAGHSVYEDATLLSRVQRALAPYPNVILLLPSPDLGESVTLLNARLVTLLEKEVGTVDPAVLAMNEHFVKHPSNHQLAKHVVFTKDKIPEETCAEIVQLLVS